MASNAALTPACPCNVITSSCLRVRRAPFVSFFLYRFDLCRLFQLFFFSILLVLRSVVRLDPVKKKNVFFIRFLFCPFWCQFEIGTVHGVFNSVAGVGGAASDIVSMLSFDEEYQSQREREKNKNMAKQGGVGQGFVQVSFLPNASCCHLARGWAGDVFRDDVCCCPLL